MRILSLLLSLLSGLPAMAQNNNVHEQSSADDYVWPDDELVLNKLHNWQDLKFGVLLHWGIYSVPGIVESWSICNEKWIRRDTTQTFDQYKQWYFNLADQFNPTQFNPRQWASVMEDAGMKYVIFTTKHHDGFCMWDTQETEYSIAHHAFAHDARRDVLRHVLNAFGERRFMLGTYFSKPDWHSQLYWWDVYPNRGRNTTYPIDQYAWRWEQFCQFTYRQMEEILSNYGPVDILWLDGGWVCTENGQDIHMDRIAQMARRHQPGLIIVDRTIRGRAGTVGAVDRLREYVANAPASSMGEMARAIVRNYCDAIEAETGDPTGARRFAERLEAAAAERADVTLFGVDYTALPVDADGVPIHVGDVMEWPYGNGEFRVNGIGGNTLFYIDKDSGECEWTAAGDKRHHHAPTVESVLWRFSHLMDMANMGTCDVSDAFDYAISMLRLAGGEDE